MYECEGISNVLSGFSYVPAGNIVAVKYRHNAVLQRSQAVGEGLQHKDLVALCFTEGINYFIS